MVTNVTSFGRSGLYDWVVQRVSAVILLAYVFFIAWILLNNPGIDYFGWRYVFSLSSVKIFTLISLLALCAHAWIGMWTVATDYLTPKMLGASANGIRFIFLLLCFLVLFVYFIWCIQILWGL